MRSRTHLISRRFQLTRFEGKSAFGSIRAFGGLAFALAILSKAGFAAFFEVAFALRFFDCDTGLRDKEVAFHERGNFTF